MANTGLAIFHYTGWLTHPQIPKMSVKALLAKIELRRENAYVQKKKKKKGQKYVYSYLTFISGVLVLAAAQENIKGGSSINLTRPS